MVSAISNRTLTGKKKTGQKSGFLLGGEGEIRTRGELPHDGFQDRYHQPLGHLSVLGL